MSIHFENVKIQSVRTEKTFYDEKQGKHIKYKNPKIIKKTLFQDDHVYDVGELYLQIKHHALIFVVDNVVGAFF